jgi:hypothetical protein
MAERPSQQSISSARGALDGMNGNKDFHVSTLKLSHSWVRVKMNLFKRERLNTEMSVGAQLALKRVDGLTMMQDCDSTCLFNPENYFKSYNGTTST